jgi:OOP family OmpA-OmpF porin
MRCNPFRWLLGIMPILLLGGVAILGERERIEKDLTARSELALEQAGLGGVKTTFEGRDARVSGLAFDEAEPDRAAKAVAKTHGVRIVHNDTKLIDKVDRYEWVAARRDGRLRLAGRVPNEKTRREIIGLARAMFPSYEVVDRMTLARGAPSLDTWLGGVGFGLKQLALLKTGQVRLDMTEMTVTGEAFDAAGYRAVKTALATGLPPGISLKADGVEAPYASPYVWTARLADGQLDIRGSVLSEKVRDDLLTAARRAVPNAKLVDAMQPARGEPEGWEAVARLLLRELARLEEGSVEIRDQNVTVIGVAIKEATADDIRAKLKEGIPVAYRTADRITFREPTIKTVSPYRTSINFEHGAATLTGYVPNEGARAALVALVQARVPGNRIVDRLELGAGAIPGWQRCLDVGLAAVSRLGGEGRLALTDRRLQVTGATESEALHKALPTETRAAANRDCDPDLQITLNVRPEPKLKWSAIASSDAVVLEGEVPGITVHDELLATARKLFASRSVTDRMVVVGEPSERWKRVATVALTQLARLRLGRARIVDQAVSIEGEARDVVVQAAIKDALGRNLPEGYASQESIVVRSDAMIAAEQASQRKAEDEQKRSELEAETKRLSATDAARQREQAEAKQRVDAAAEAETRRQQIKQQAEEESRRRSTEEATRVREANAARQRAETEAKQRAVDDARRRADEAAKLQRESETRRAEQERVRLQAQADTCGTVLQKVATDGVIQFAWASDDLDRRSYPTLNKLAEAARTCPVGIIEIEGHTDSEGIDERNLPLSERRAQAVLDYLIKAGVPAARMKAVGYGASRPVAPNDTSNGRARNRRIEFAVKVK